MNKTDTLDLSAITALVERMERIESKLDMLLHYNKVEEAIPLPLPSGDRHSFFRFMEEQAGKLKHLGRVRTGETYIAALRSFARFRQGKDVALGRINSDLMQRYEAYLAGRGLSKNTVSFYMRILRAAYNCAVEKGFTAQRNPFRHVYTGVDKTVKRAIPLSGIRSIRQLDLSARPLLGWARDMFLFSFYTRGMSFIDMAYLKKTDLRDGMLSYRRQKTGQRLMIRWEKCMQEIVDRYRNDSSEYLLPIVTCSGASRKQYQNALHLVNRHLKVVSRMAKLNVNLSMYVARHSWASIAKEKHVPLSVISEGMGHESELTTQIYLVSFDGSQVDKANSLIISEL